MKRTQCKSSSTSKPPKKQTKVQSKIHIKLRSRKINQNTASTLGSRSSMDSKLTRRKFNTEDKIKTCRIGLMKQRGSAYQYGIENANKKSTFALKLQENNGQENICEELVSFREYCMVGNQWIPLLTSTQRQRIVNPVLQKNYKMIETTKLKSQEDIPNSQTSKKQRTSITRTLQKLKEEIEQNENQLQDIPIEKKQQYYKILKNVISKLHDQKQDKKQIEEKQQELNVLKNISNKQPRDLIQEENNKKNGQKSYRLLHRNKGIDKENQNETSIGEPYCNDTSLTEKQKNQNLSEQQIENNLDDSSPVKSLKFDQEPYQVEPSMEDMIKLRQLKQMGILFNNSQQYQHQNGQNSHMKIDTSITCISNYIKNILYVMKQSNFTAEILSNLKLAWGYQKIEKLSRIRHNKYLGSSTDVLPECLFEYVEDYTSKNNLYQFIQNKCIFDCLNYELNKLKPFFQSNGQTFPWNFKLSSPLTFFQIDQSSLILAFQQIKIKMLQFSSLLCGLIIEQPQQHHQFHLLVRRRHEKQNIMLKKYNDSEQNQNIQDNAIENQAVLILQKVTTSIFMDLISQFTSSIPNI